MQLLGEKRKSNLLFHEVDLENDSQVTSFIETQWTERGQRRQALERQWYLNVAYYMGFQYLRWIDDDLRLPKTPPWRVRLVINKLQGIVRNIVSKFLKQKPTWNVIPATSDPEDILTARLSEKVLQYYWRHCRMTHNLIDLITWQGTCGNAFLRTGWDPDLGPEMSFSAEELGGGDKEQGLGILAKLLGKKAPDVEQALASAGDLYFEVLSPFEVEFDPAALRAHEAEYAIESRSKSISALENRYGEKITTRSDETQTKFYMDRIASFGGTHSFAGLGDQHTSISKDTAIEHTLWVKPCKKYRDGYFVTAVGNKVLARGDLDGLQEIPIAHFKEIHVPGRFWGTCALEQCMGLQQEYNRARSQVIENRNLMSRPKWIKYKGSGVHDNALTSEPGEVIQANFGMKPEQVVVQAIPDYVHKTIDHCQRDLEDVSAQREVSNARAPGGVRAGVAIAQLQEADDSIMAPSLYMAEEELGRVGSWALRLLARHVREERLLKITGDDGHVFADKFTGEQLVGEKKEPGINYFDVEVQMGSQLPLSKAARMEFIIQLVQYNILNPDQHRMLILKMLDIGSAEPVFSEAKLDENAVHRENILLAQGHRLAINDWDNDKVHIEALRSYQKTPEYERLRMVDPEIDMRFGEHVQLHAQRLEELEMVQGGGVPPAVEPKRSEGPGAVPGQEQGQATDPIAELAGQVARQQQESRNG